MSLASTAARDRADPAAEPATPNPAQTAPAPSVDRGLLALAIGLRAKRLDAIPYPAIVGLKTGGFALIAAAPVAGRVRLIDPAAQSAVTLTLREAETLSSGQVVLITRRLGGAGVDPRPSASAGSCPRSCAIANRSARSWSPHCSCNCSRC
jgi:hypothetical protein